MSKYLLSSAYVSTVYMEDTCFNAVYYLQDFYDDDSMLGGIWIKRFLYSMLSEESRIKSATSGMPGCAIKKVRGK